ncbi:MAG: hypothetical protein V4628_11495 [Pseudomonadota bacterium]
MDDREIVKRSAEAMGYHPISPYEQGHGMGIGVSGVGIRNWNPLENDGDALRLAVKLQLTVCNEQIGAGVAYCTRDEGEDFPMIYSGNDQAEVVAEDYAATRRAIVVAAAQIASKP